MFLDRDSELKDISEIYGDSFTSVHQDFIKEFLYNDGWTSYEESGGLIVFEGTDNNLYYLEHAYSVMESEHLYVYQPILSNESEILKLMLEMDETIEENNKSM